jgi:hypothetical protein
MWVASLPTYRDVKAIGFYEVARINKTRCDDLRLVISDPYMYVGTCMMFIPSVLGPLTHMYTHT